MRDRVRLQLSVNGRGRIAEVDVRTSLRDCLHGALGCTEVKQGCAEGVCGACVVMLDGEPRASCLELAVASEEREIRTAIGLEDPIANRLRGQFVARQVFQCGYCAPGFVVEAAHYIAQGGTAEHSAIRDALAGHLCRCTGYQQIVDAVAATITGEPPPEGAIRPDLEEKLQASALYPTDHQPEGVRIARIVWSAHASAKILAIDATPARAVPGVIRVLTWRDIPGANLGAESIFAEDQPLLARDLTRCLGDAVAIVVAESDAAAREGASAVNVVYEPRPAVHTVDLEDVDRHNTIAQFIEVRGDVDDAFASSEVIVEGTYRSEINDHVCMEPEGGLATWDGKKLVLTIPSHSPHPVRQGIAKALAVDERQIELNTPRMGGAFGKYLVPGVEGLLALAAFVTGEPTRLVLDRGEILARRAKRHPFVGAYRLGLLRDGTFRALDANVLTDAGPYVSITPTVVSVFADEICGAYRFDAVRARARGVVTNNLVSSPMRGFGSQQINFGIEAIVAKAAMQLGLDPIELRRRNFARDPTEASPLDQVVDRVVQHLAAKPPPAPGTRIGRGVAAVRCKYGFPYGFVDRFVVRVGLDPSGKVVVESDLADSGTGALAGASRLVAHELGIAKLPITAVGVAMVGDPTGIELATGRPPTRWRRGVYRFLERLQGIQASLAMSLVVRMSARTEARIMKWFARPINALNGTINWLKSRWFPLSVDSFLPRSGSSRAMFMIGTAAVAAAQKFRARAISIAAATLAVPPADLRWTSDGIAGPSRTMTWVELATHTPSGLGQAHLPAGKLIDVRSGNQTGCVDYMYAAQAVDIAVDEQTGRVRILKWIAAQDVGAVIDETTVRGQVHGSLAMGMGQAMFEHLAIRDGAVVNATMHDYLIPSILDVPADPVIELVESHQGHGPRGAKGVGEASAVAAPIALIHALYDATGIQFDMTVTPEQIAMRIREKDHHHGIG